MRNPWLRRAWPLKETAPRVFQTFIIHTFVYLVLRISKMWTKWQIYLTEFKFQKIDRLFCQICLYIYKEKEIITFRRTVQSYLTFSHVTWSNTLTHWFDTRDELSLHTRTSEKKYLCCSSTRPIVKTLSTDDIWVGAC